MNRVLYGGKLRYVAENDFPQFCFEKGLIMSRTVYVNLPVADLQRSVEFFTALGFSFNPQFTNENATCMIVSDTIFVMLLVKPFFQTFTNRRIADATESTEVLIALSCESREEVDAVMEKALAAGATLPAETQDHGFMYGRSFADLDGHIWELGWMDVSRMP
jgi:predicted lactoylglutathione lyase